MDANIEDINEQQLEILDDHESLPIFSILLL